MAIGTQQSTPAQAHQHKGDVGRQSDAERGARSRVELPLADVRATGFGRRLEENERQRHNQRDHDGAIEQHGLAPAEGGHGALEQGRPQRAREIAAAGNERQGRSPAPVEPMADVDVHRRVDGADAEQPHEHGMADPERRRAGRRSRWQGRCPTITAPKTTVDRVPKRLATRPMSTPPMPAPSQVSDNASAGTDLAPPASRGDIRQGNGGYPAGAEDEHHHGERYESDDPGLPGLHRGDGRYRCVHRVRFPSSQAVRGRACTRIRHSTSGSGKQTAARAFAEASAHGRCAPLFPVAPAARGNRARRTQVLPCTRHSLLGRGWG